MQSGENESHGEVRRTLYFIAHTRLVAGRVARRSIPASAAARLRIVVVTAHARAGVARGVARAVPAAAGAAPSVEPGASVPRAAVLVRGGGAVVACAAVLVRRGRAVVASCGPG